MPNKRTFLWLSIALSVVGVLCLLLWLLPMLGGEDTPDEEASYTLFDQNTPDLIDSLTFVCGENAALSFERTDGNWQLDGHPALPISNASISALTDKLAHMLALRIITDSCDSPAEYGLDSPYCRIRITSDGQEKVYLFGSRNEYYAGYYCMIEGGSTVYMVDEAFVEAFDLTLEDLLGSDNLPDLGSLRSVVWHSADGTTVTVTPDSAHSALLTLLSSLELGKWIDYGEAQYPLFGLDNPAVAELTLWDDAPLVLSFGLGESDEYIYLRIGESEMIYLAACDDLSALGEYIRGGF